VIRVIQEALTNVASTQAHQRDRPDHERRRCDVHLDRGRRHGFDD
jgi:hypothetical protein